MKSKKIILLISGLIVLSVVGGLMWLFWPKEKPAVDIFTIPDDLEIFVKTQGSYYPVEVIFKIKADGSAYYKYGFYAGETLAKKPPFEKTGKISEEEIKEILKSFYDNNFFSLQKFYNNPNVLDAETTTITINLEGKSYTVGSYAGAGPKSLHNIIEKLNSIRNKIIATPGRLKLTLNGKKFVEESADKTKENIKNFVQNIDAKIEIINIEDQNYHHQIITWAVFNDDMSPEEYPIYWGYKDGGYSSDGKGLEKDPAVSEVTITLINNRDVGWKIKFKKPLHISEIEKFLDKYPRLKEKLFFPKLNKNKYYDINIEIIFPEGLEDQYLNNLSSKYSEQILKVERVLPDLW